MHDPCGRGYQKFVLGSCSEAAKLLSDDDDDNNHDDEDDDEAGRC